MGGWGGGGGCRASAQARYKGRLRSSGVSVASAAGSMAMRGARRGVRRGGAGGAAAWRCWTFVPDFSYRAPGPARVFAFRSQNASRRRPPVGPLGEVKLKGKYLSITIHRSENELDESETPRPFPHLKRKASEIYLRVKAPTLHPGVLDIRGRSDFSRFDPRPERPHFSNFGPPAERRPFFVERRPFCETPPAVGL